MAVLRLLADAVPIVLGKDDGQLLPGRRVAGPVHGDDVDAVLLVHPPDVPFGAQADVVQPLVYHRFGAVAHLLIVDVGDCHLQRKALAGKVLGDVGFETKGEAPLLVGGARATGNQFAVETVIVLVSVAAKVIVGKVPPARALIVKKVVGGEDRVAHLGTGDGAAKVVSRLGSDVDLVTLDVLWPVCLDRHLELGLAVLGDLEAGAKVFILVGGLNGVKAQRRLFVQHEFAVQRAHVTEGHVVLKDLGALRIPNLDLDFGISRWQGIVGVVVLPQDALEVDRLAGAVDGPVGEKVGGERLQVILHRQVEFPGRDAIGPLAADRGKILIRVVRVADESENWVPRVQRLVFSAGKDAIPAGRPLGQDAGMFVHHHDGQAGQDVAGAQVGGPDQRLGGGRFHAQVVPGDDQHFFLDIGR